MKQRQDKTFSESVKRGSDYAGAEAIDLASFDTSSEHCIALTSNSLLNAGGAGVVEEPVNATSGSAPAVKSRRSPSSWSTYYKDSHGNSVHMVDRPIEVTFSRAQQLFGISRRTLLRASQRPENDPAHLRTFPHRPSVVRTDWLFKFMFGNRHTGGLR